MYLRCPGCDSLVDVSDAPRGITIDITPVIDGRYAFSSSGWAESYTPGSGTADNMTASRSTSAMSFRLIHECPLDRGTP